MQPQSQPTNQPNQPPNQANQPNNSAPSQPSSAQSLSPSSSGDASYQPAQPSAQVPRVTLQTAEVNLPTPSSNRPVPRSVEWKAKEYIAAEKGILWYVGLGLVVIGGIILDFLVLKSWTVSMLVVAIAAVLIVMSVRPARDINYRLSSEGLSVGEIIYDLSEYKAFGVLHDGKENSIYLMPIKRFKPGLSVYFPVEYGEQIVDFLSSRMPMQEVKLDFIDKIVRLFRL